MTIADKIQPLGDRVVVRLLAAEEKTQGGLIVPDAAKEKPKRGEVVAVGPGRVEATQIAEGVPIGYRHVMEIKVGDQVLFAKWGVNEVKIGGETLAILREDDILAIVK